MHGEVECSGCSGGLGPFPQKKLPLSLVPTFLSHPLTALPRTPRRLCRPRGTGRVRVPDSTPMSDWVPLDPTPPRGSSPKPPPSLRLVRKKQQKNLFVKQDDEDTLVLSSPLATTPALDRKRIRLGRRRSE